HRLDDVTAAAERAINDDLCASGDGVDDLRQHFHRATAMIELTPSVVGDVDPLDPVIECDGGILRGGNSLDGEGNIEFLLDALDGGPAERGLKPGARPPPAAGGDKALGDIALAAAVVRDIDGEAEAGIAVRNRALDVVVDPGGIAAHVELKEPARVRCRLRPV